MPPRAKLFEAFGAVAEDRVNLTGPTRAEVTSSGRDKSYQVEWSSDTQEITSNHNASYWQGHLGYPIVAVLRAIGRLTSDAEAVPQMSGVPWSSINKRFKPAYQKAVDHVLAEIAAKGGSPDLINGAVDEVLDQLKGLKLKKGPRPSRPAGKG